jgi:toluene monooxygenase system ferredoxin subunit
MTRCRVTEADELVDGEMCGAVAGGRRVLVVRLDGRVYAYEDRCPHLGVRLSEGELEGAVLTCRAHHFQFDARTGAGVNPRNVRLRAWRAEVRDGEVSVDVEAAP